ncbi:hypothetical protein V8E55_007410 [Tylopilus felleus]
MASSTAAAPLFFPPFTPSRCDAARTIKLDDVTRTPTESLSSYPSSRSGHVGTNVLGRLLSNSVLTPTRRSRPCSFVRSAAKIRVRIGRVHLDHVRAMKGFNKRHKVRRLVSGSYDPTSLHNTPLVFRSGVGAGSLVGLEIQTPTLDQAYPKLVEESITRETCDQRSIPPLFRSWGKVPDSYVVLHGRILGGQAGHDRACALEKTTTSSASPDRLGSPRRTDADVVQRLVLCTKP